MVSSRLASALSAPDSNATLHRLQQPEQQERDDAPTAASGSCASSCRNSPAQRSGRYLMARRSLLDQRALVEVQLAAGVLGRLGIVGDHHDGLAVLAVEHLQQRQDLVARWRGRGRRWARRRPAASGSETMARAIATRCSWPPDSSLGLCSARSARPTSVSAIAARRRRSAAPTARSAAAAARRSAAPRAPAAGCRTGRRSRRWRRASAPARRCRAGRCAGRRR